MAKYGIPYMGSKGPIADWVLSLIPEAENFYDLFGGGFSITHAAMLKDKWKSFYFNEIKDDVVQLIKESIAGNYSYDVFKPEFVTREMFERQKNNCAYTRVIWSFGNNQKDYLFGKNIEERKKSLHNAVIHNEFDETSKSLLDFDSWPKEFQSVLDRRLFIRKKVREKLGNDAPEQLQQLQQLERLQRLQRLQQLEFSSVSYELVPIKQKSVVYCDIPYIGTRNYGGLFDHRKFYEWARNAEFPVFISEYNMPDDFFTLGSISKNQKLCASKTKKAFIEKVFCNQPGLVLFNNRKMHKRLIQEELF